MKGKIQLLKEKGADKAIFPVTVADAVKMGNKTLRQTLDELSSSAEFFEVNEQGLHFIDTGRNIGMRLDNGSFDAVGIGSRISGTIREIVSENNTSALSTVYVSMSGRNDNDGSESNPVNTIPRALELAEYLPSDRVYIVILEGEYRLSETIAINSDKKIHFVAKGNVTIKGSRQVNFTLSSEGIVKSTVSGHKVSNIFVNGIKRFVASTPRPDLLASYTGCTIPDGLGTYTGTDGILYTYFPMSPGDIQALSANDSYKTGWITVFKNWTSMKYRILKVDTVTNRIEFRVYQNPSGEGNLTPFAGNRITFENMNLILDINKNESLFTEGSYYYDNNGYIYYKLRKNENEYVQIEVPVVENLFDIHSEVSFDGFNFSQTDYDFFDAVYACSDTQSAYGITPSIRCYGKNISFTNCGFADFSQTPVGFMNGSSYCNVDSCHIHNCGCTSVRIGELDQDAVNVPYKCSVTNSVIEWMGELLQQSAGIVLTFADDCRIEHNDISKCFYTGITTGHVWNPKTADTAFRNCKLKYNKIHHLCGFHMSDFGGIYNLGATRGLLIECNEISWICGSHAFGIYLDEGTKESIVRNNVCYITGYSIHLHHTWYNLIENNIFARPTGAALYFSNLNEHETIKRNIFYLRKTSLTGGTFPADVSVNKIYGNIWFNPVVTLNPTFDSDPLVADPCFADMENNNYSITNTSNADIIRFESIDTSRFGVINSRLAHILAASRLMDNKFEMLYKGAMN